MFTIICKFNYLFFFYLQDVGPIATTATFVKPCLLGGVPLRGAGGGGGRGGASSRGALAPPGGLATAT